MSVIIKFMKITWPLILLILLIYNVFSSLYPSTLGARPAGKRAQAKNDVAGLVTAIHAYYAEYGAMPDGDFPAIMKTLMGNNPHEIVFIVIGRDSLDTAGRFLDPWKSPYRIDVSDPTNPKVWSLGKNKIDAPNDENSGDICSWR